jgi:hypothetical protein
VVARLAADFVVIAHLGFILFVVLGGLLVLRWPRVALVHVPAALWGAAVELTGWLCPLTPFENTLRSLGGQTGYEQGFIAHYVLPIIYPAGLTRELQLVLAALVVVINTVVYARVIIARRRTR